MINIHTYNYVAPLTPQSFLAHRFARHRSSLSQTLGSDALFQGKGIGSKLISHGIDRAETLNVPCYLESSNPRNVPFYERHGFKTVELWYPFEDAAAGTYKDGDGNKLEGKAPLMTLMIRPCSAAKK